MNNDRIMELYNREIWEPKLQEVARDRIHWICSKAKGPKVLDIGCSQGTAPILLAREGYEVLGVDINPESIEYAQKYQEREFPATLSRCRFLCADVFALETEEKFNTIILSEVLEHFSEPTILLDRALEFLAPEGRVIITVPFGIHRDPDHKSTHTLRSMHRLLNRSLRIEELHASGKYIRAVAEKKSSNSRQKPKESYSDTQLLEMTDSAMLEAEANYLDRQREAGTSVYNLKAQLAETEKKLAAAQQQEQALRKSMQAEIDAKQNALAEVNRKVTEEGTRSVALGKELEDLRQRYQADSNRKAELEHELSGIRDSLNGETAKRASLEKELEILRPHLKEESRKRTDLERELSTIRERLNTESGTRTSLEKEIEQLRSMQNEASAQRIVLEKECELLRQKVSESSARLAELDERYRITREKSEQDDSKWRETLDREREHYKQRMLEEASRRLELEKERDLAREKLNAEISRRAVADRELEQTRTRLNEESLQRSILEREREELVRHRNELNGKLGGLDQSLKRAERALQQKSDELNKVEFLRSSLEDELEETFQMLNEEQASREDFEHKCTSLQDRLDDVEQVQQQMEEEIAEYSKALQFESERLEASEQEHEYLTRALELETEARTKAENELKQLLLDCREAESRIAKLDNDILSLQAANEDARTRHRNDVTALTAEIEKAERLYSEKVDQITSLRNDLTAQMLVLRSELDKQRQTNDLLTDEIQEKTVNVEHLHGQLRYTKDLAEALEARCESLAAQLAAMEGQVQRLYIENQRKNNNYLRIRHSIGYEFGHSFLNALLRPGKNTLRFPGDLVRLLKESKSRKAEVEALRAANERLAAQLEAAPTQPTPSTFTPPVSIPEPSPLAGPPASPEAGEKAKVPVPVEEAPTSNVSSAPSVSTPPVYSPQTSPSLGLTTIRETASGIEPLPFESPVKPAVRKLRAASILDTFTQACFEPECELVPLRPENWMETFKEQDIDFLFVESAWNGNDGAWLYRVAKYNAPRGNELADIIAWCKKLRIPTVFWNKEDPPNFDRFVDRAGQFDHIFTTDANCIPGYKEKCPHARTIEALPFAAQPTIHNPRLFQPRLDRTCFAGTYYADTYKERRAWMDTMLRAAAEFGLDIFDRMHHVTGDQKKRYLFPEDLRPHIKGKLEYDEMIAAYRQYRVFLNVNSVFDSPTMFSRRVFELLACGTPVVTTPSLGIGNYFGDLVPQVETREQVVSALDSLMNDRAYWARESARGIRKVFAGHTYADRLESIFRIVGLPTAGFAKQPVVVVANPGGEANRFVARMKAQTVVPAQVVVPGVASSDDSVARLLETLQANGFDALALPPGNIPSFVRNRHEGAALALCDTRCYYGPDYLLDVVHALKACTDHGISGIVPHLNAEYSPVRADLDALEAVGFTRNAVALGSLATTAERLDGEIMASAFTGETVEVEAGACCRYGFDFALKDDLSAEQSKQINLGG